MVNIKESIKEYFMKILADINQSFPLNYDIWKKDRDKIYYNINTNLRKDWLSISHSFDETPVLIFILTILFLIYLETHIFIIFLVIFILVILILIQNGLFSRNNERYINEKYLEMSKK